MGCILTTSPCEAKGSTASSATRKTRPTSPVTRTGGDFVELKDALVFRVGVSFLFN